MSKMNYDKTNRTKLMQARMAQTPDPRFDNLVQEVKPMTTPKPPPQDGTVRTVVMEITVEQATKWLEGNTHNRHLRPVDVDKMALDIQRGRWKLNGESIIFADDSTLLDGQHRLWAIVESGMSITSVVVFGIPRETFTTIDQGRARSLADHLTVMDIHSPNNNQLAAIASAILRYRTNQVFSKVKMEPERVISLLQSEPEISSWFDKARRAPKGLQGWATPIASVLYIGSRSMNDEAEMFLHQWLTGSDLKEGSPVLALRQKILNTTRVSTVGWERIFLVTSAWNAFVQNRQMFKMGTLRGDRFPPIAGDTYKRKE